MSWTAGAYAGHDDEVLIDPLVQGPTIPVADRFFTGSSRFLLHLADDAERAQADLILDVAGTVYGEVPDNDLDLRITNAIRARLSSRFVLDGALVAWRFRRGSGSVFDLDMIRPELRIIWTPSEAWLVTPGVKAGWLTFPFRESGEDSVYPGRQGEDQHQLDVLVGVVRSLGRGYGGFEAAYRGTRSTLPEAEYEGPVMTLRGGVLWRRQWDLSTYAVYGHRGYDTLIPAEDGTPMKRQDDTYQVGLTVEWLAMPRARILVDGAVVRQNSTIADFGYDQLRVSVGISLDLVDTLPRRSLHLTPPGRPLAPAITPQGVTFYCRAPQGREVSIVGGWNGWDPSRGRMTGPDAGGVWRLTVPLAPGRWRYAFVIDGVWTAPVDAPQVEDDGFGGGQGIVVVDRSATGM